MACVGSEQMQAELGQHKAALLRALTPPSTTKASIIEPIGSHHLAGCLNQETDTSPAGITLQQVGG